MTRSATRLSTAALLTLCALAALAPLLASARPLAARSAAGWSFPALAALHAADFLWFGAFLAALGLALPCRGRLTLVACAALLVVWGTAFHHRRVELAPAEVATFRVEAPIRHGKGDTDLSQRFAPPLTRGHPLGTDEIGRDVAARLVFGLRMSLLAGFAATAVGLVAGVAFGVLAGCGGRVADAVASLIVQTSFCLPAVFVVATAQSIGRGSLLVVILVLALLRFGVIARLVRQECMRVRALPFVVAARGLGLHPLRVIGRHVLPHALIPATVAAAFGVAGAILAEAGLAFLGLGVAEGEPSLGRMLGDGRRAMPFGAHLVWLPGVVLLVLVLACHALGSAFRDRLDPRGAEASS